MHKHDMVGKVFADAMGDLVVLRKINKPEESHYTYDVSQLAQSGRRLDVAGSKRVADIFPVGNYPKLRNLITSNSYEIGEIDAVQVQPEKATAHWHRGGPDYIARTAGSMTVEGFRGALTWTIGKYCDRFGHKDAHLKEAKKIQDYANRLVEFEEHQLQSQGNSVD